jgi:hypothetical protein
MEENREKGFGKFGRNISLIVIRYRKYGRK